MRDKERMLGLRIWTILLIAFNEFADAIAIVAVGFFMEALYRLLTYLGVAEKGMELVILIGCSVAALFLALIRFPRVAKIIKESGSGRR